MAEEHYTASNQAATAEFDHRAIMHQRLLYQVWWSRRLSSADDLYRQHAQALAMADAPRISIVTPLYKTPPDALRRMLHSVRMQTYTNWEHCLVDDGSGERWLVRQMERAAARDPRIRFQGNESNRGIVAASNDGLALATGTFVAFLDHDDTLEPDALYRMVEALQQNPDADLLYSDFDVIDMKGGPFQPYFCPGWSPELLLSLPFAVHLTVYRRALLEELGGLRPGLDGAQDYDLVLRLSERTDRVVHVPRVLYHWWMSPTSAANNNEAKPFAVHARERAITDHLQRRQTTATVEEYDRLAGYHVVRFAIVGRPTVGVVVRVDDLSSDLGALTVESTGGVSVDIRPVRATADAAADWNSGAADSRSDHLVFLEQPLAALTADWISALVEFSQQPAIGAVGAKVTSHDRRIVEAGVVFPKAVPQPVLRGAPASSFGYFLSIVFPMNYRAVGGACVMTRRAVFEEVGGFRPVQAVGFPDLDYCLRVGDLGYRVVSAPRAELTHPSGESMAMEWNDSARLRTFGEQWSERLGAIDPYYNPNFRQDAAMFTFDLD